MSKGRKNSLAKQIGEHLVCAELGRLNLIATPFSGNVPNFDILAADEQCNTVPIQVKASRGKGWGTDASKWLRLHLDEETKTQINEGPQEIENPDLVYVHVAIAAPEEGKKSGDECPKDRFFILTKRQLQVIAIRRYSAWMDSKGWKRPKKHGSFDCRYEINDLKDYENKWGIITDKLKPSATEPESDSPDESCS